jgi:hypothetical protein
MNSILTLIYALLLLFSFFFLFFFYKLQSWTWWFMAVIPAFGKLRQEDFKFESSLYYIARPYLFPSPQNEN